MKHWNENDFLNKLYGIDAEDGHLDACETCYAVFEKWRAARAQVLIAPEISAADLAVQRQRIFDRVDAQRRAPAGWTPALAMAAMAVAVILWKAPGPTPQQPMQTFETAGNTKSDAQLMADIYKTVYDSEPAAIEPVRALFEERQ